MNGEFKKIFGKVKAAQAKLQGIIQDQDWMDEARKYAEKQRSEMKKLLSAENIAKVEKFVQKQRKELERLQKQLPGEVEKLRAKIKAQRKDLEKLLRKVGKANVSAKKPKKAPAKKTRSSGTRQKKSSS